MREIAPGLWHWTARHELIRIDVSSYYLLAERILIDPMIPAEGLPWFEAHGAPEHVLLTNRHHDREAWQLRDAFGCRVHCVRSGLPELDGRGPVEAFDFGDDLPGGVIVYEVDAICPTRRRSTSQPIERWPAQTASCACPAATNSGSFPTN